MRHYNRLYIFYPIFHCRLYLRAVYSSFFKPKIRGLYKRAVTDQERVIVARVQCVKSKKMKLPDKTTSWKQLSEFPDYLLSQDQKLGQNYFTLPNSPK